MENKTTKQPEIKDRKLIIDNTEYSLEAFEMLFQDSDPSCTSSDLQEIFTSISIMSALISEAGPSGKVDGELLSLNLPSYDSLYALRVVIKALKKA